jgi:outer membrane protein TolC
MNLPTQFRWTSLFRSALALFAAIPLAAQGLHFSDAGQFNGSVANGTATATPLKLSLQDAIGLGIKNNLGILVRSSEASTARIERMRALSALLPNLNAGITETETQISLSVYGFHFAGLPSVVGPFNYTDVRANLSAPFNWSSFKKLKAAAEDARAAELSLNDGRDLVVQSVASGYIAILAAGARVDVTRDQIATAEIVVEGARDAHSAGLVPAIEELRAGVELKTQQQRLLVLQNMVAKQKLVLARAIGLPYGQNFELSDKAPFSPLDNLSEADILKKAYDTRADYRSGEAQLHAAEIGREAAHAQRYPTGSLVGNYGDIGPSLANSHGTFYVAGTLSFNLFDGGKIHADELASDTEITRRRNDLQDLRGKIDFEVRSALLDLRSAADEVSLARSNVDLATQTLNQATDRVKGGVADNLEITQAQEALAAANQDLINGEYAHNLAKVALARAVGGTEQALTQYLGSK